ncbi:PREDICTED: protein Shroom3 [Nanorana parkeri]|uniref:protein Shroom3 n=1 Tax=Nanorana parkeri TaxID=125878 RepID=UPI00085464B0|nr:PREDICTED: protein Shroom3 [Nanorana parkeri]
MMQISQGTLGSPWHQAYHSSSSASDLSSYEHGYLRRSPDQYSSRGSMESLDHTSSTYHPCHLSPAKSTNCIDQLAHLHSKRDSAYSSFSTNSSIPEYHPTTFCKEKSYSMESMLSRGNLQEGIKHADIRYIKTVYDAQRGVSEEYEVNSSMVKSRGRLSSLHLKNSGPVGRFEQNRILSESDIVVKSPPMPPTRSDSYAVARHHERPSSWSSLDQNRHLRTSSKGPGTHSAIATCNSNQQLKAAFGEGQLHTVPERSPECSPLMKPKHVYSHLPQPGQPMLPTGIYQVPSPEPHFAHAPQPPNNNNGRLYPALAKEGAHSTSFADPGTKAGSCSQLETNVKGSQNIQSIPTVPSLVNQSTKAEETREGGPAQYTHYKLHFSGGPDFPVGSTLNSEDERTLTNINPSFNTNDHLPKPESKTDAITNQVRSGQQDNWDMQVFSTSERIKSHTGPALQNRGSSCNTSSDVSTPDTNKYKNSGIQYKADTNHNDKHENRHPVHASNHKNKLESPSFTKHTEDADSSVIYVTNHLQPDDPSSPHNNTTEFIRRRQNSVSNQSSNSLSSVKQDGKQRSSVFQKISQIEQREQENQKPHAPSGSIYGQNSGQCTKGGNRASVNSIEDLRNKFNSQEHAQNVEYRRLSGSHTTDKGSGVHQLKRAGSVYSSRLGDIQKAAAESQIDKTQEINNEPCVLQTLLGSDTTTGNSQTMPNKEDHWQNTAQDTLGFSRAYRNSIKDAQSKVLEATSYRRKDLEISPPQKKTERSVKRPSSAILYGKSAPVSPHAPKERHSVTPMETFAKSQDFHSQEGTALSNQVTRIGARRRLTAEQKKRSYSEPEKMNEVGASDTESSSISSQKKGQNISFLEQTVADRRRMFERDGKACSTVNLSKPELKQMQQNALADYIERKTGRRPSPLETGLLKVRSQSTYFSGSMMDSQSVSSTSSINSLQEHNMPFHSWDPRDTLSKPGRVSSTLPPGLTGLFDLANLEKKSEHQENRGRASSFIQQRLGLDFKPRPEGKSSSSHKQREVTALKPSEFLMVSSEQKPDRTVSDRDLYANSQQPTALHVRSRSSPANEKASQDLLVRRESLIKHASYSSTNKELRSSRSKTEDHPETAPSETTLQPHFIHHSPIEVERMGSPSNNMVDQSNVKIRRHIRAQSLTQHSNLQSTRLATLPSPSNFSPNKTIQDSPSQKTQDTTEDYLYTERRTNISSAEAKSQSALDLSVHSNNSMNQNHNKLHTKYTPPQRPPPPKVKGLNLTKEANISQNSTISGPKAPTGWKNNAMWSSSSSDSETPSHHGKISLRISESGLQLSPVVGNDDVDDEVFVKDQELETSPEIKFVPPSPPPFPPPTLEDALLKEKQETMQTLLATPPKHYKGNVRKDWKEIYPKTVEGTETMETTTEKSDLNMPTAIALIRESEVPQASASSSSEIPQSTTSFVRTGQSSQNLPPTQDEETSNVALKHSEDIHTYNHVSTSMMSPEDVKSQELAKEIVDKDKSLADILDPEFKMKTTMDVMGGLFMRSPSALRENKRQIKDKMMSEDLSSSHNGKKEDKKNSTENVLSISTHFSMSASKVELLQKITDSQIEGKADVNGNKVELVTNLIRKLDILKGAKESLIVDIKLNNRLGEQVETLVEQLCKPNEFDKYKMFIGDLEKVVNLLLSLSGRLARVENVLCTLGEDANAEERNTWNEKKKQLCGQHEDARELKENLDRREKLVMEILGNYLTRDQFQDYQHFVKMKSALLIEQRELDDKIKLGQEQLDCLLESLPKDFMDNRKVPLKEESVSSSGNVKMLPPLTTSL